MKISIGHILRAHFATLRNADTGRLSVGDVILFFMFPVGIGFITFLAGLRTGKEFYNLSITFFGIFIALLLNIQVAIFGIFQRNWGNPSDHIIHAIQSEKREDRRKLLRELNINVSYLITISCLALTAFITMFATDAQNIASTVGSVVLYGHFLLTLLMVVKRTYALFQGEYDLGG